MGPCHCHKGPIGIYHGGPGGPPNFSRNLESGEIYFLEGFGGRWACPNASWVPYNPFRSYRFPSNTMGNIFLNKTNFFRNSLLAPTGPRPSRNPLGSKSGIRGSKNGPRGLKYQSCVLNNHARNSGWYSKRSHMLQLMAENHPGPSKGGSGGKVSSGSRQGI